MTKSIIFAINCAVALAVLYFGYETFDAYKDVRTAIVVALGGYITHHLFGFGASQPRAKTHKESTEESSDDSVDNSGDESTDDSTDSISED